jgi:hypothetical protein
LYTSEIVYESSVKEYFFNPSYSETLSKPLMWLVTKVATFSSHLPISATMFSTQHSLPEYSG